MADRRVLRFFFVLTALGRISIAVGLLERPLVQGMILGFVSGQWGTALPLALILELFWLDCIRLGSVVPPMASLGYLAVVPCLFLYSVAIPEQLAVPFLCALVLALVGAWVERRLRLRANAFIPEVQAWIDGKGGISPEGAVRRSLWRQAAVYSVLYVAAFATVSGVFSVLQGEQMLPRLPFMTENMWYALAAVGAVLALRIRRAYVVLGVSLVFICVVQWWGA